MNNKLEQKKRFFALYWGQKVGCINNNDNKNWEVGQCALDSLELKPISQISDKDVTYCVELMGKKILDGEIDGFRETFIEAFINKEFYGTFYPYRVCEIIDFLRSKGYALPFMEYSVDDLVEMGWVKLKENEKIQ